jgi:hypothetical protein
MRDTNTPNPIPHSGTTGAGRACKRSPRKETPLHATAGETHQQTQGTNKRHAIANRVQQRRFGTCKPPAPTNVTGGLPPHPTLLLLLMLGVFLCRVCVCVGVALEVFGLTSSAGWWYF